MKNVVLPRHAQDVATKRRTLFHDIEGDFKVGEEFSIVGHPNACRGLVATVAKVERVQLADLTTVDAEKLNCPKEDYLARWNALHPGWRGEVFAVEFRYGFATSMAR